MAQLQNDWYGSESGASSPTSAGWFDNNWKYRREINISNAGASGLSDYQVWIPTTSFTSSEWNDIKSKTQGDMDDFRFTPTTAITTIPYWIYPDTNTPAGFWVKVSTVTTAGSSIFMYYGNNNAGTGQNGDDTFEFFDNFSGTSLDIAKWDINVGNYTITYSVTGGQIRVTDMTKSTDVSWIYNNTDVGGQHQAKYGIVDNVIIEWKNYAENTGDMGEVGMALVDSSKLVRAYLCHYDGNGGSVNSRRNWQYEATSLGEDGDLPESKKFKIVRYGTAVKFYIDNVEKAVGTLTGTPSKLALAVGAYAGYTFRVSEISHLRTRKYAAPEPTIGSVGAEEGKYYTAGNYKANVLDSGVVGAKVHQVGWNPLAQAAGTTVNVYARASNTLFAAGDITPSWTSVSNGGNPNLVGRYIQWMSTFTTTSSTTTPKIEDITLTYTSPPPAPAVDYNAGDSYTQITWKWADNSSGQYQEDGFKVYSSTGGILKTLSANTTCWTEAGLKRNTKYGRYVQSHNTAGSNNSATVNKKTQPCVWQEKTTTRTGPNAFGFEGDGVWTWKVPANGGSLLTITAFVRYNSNYGSASKPKLTLYNYGINASAQATAAAENNWEKLTVSGTPTGKGVLFLKVEGYSTAVGAKYFVDDIQVNQP